GDRRNRKSQARLLDTRKCLHRLFGHARQWCTQPCYSAVRKRANHKRQNNNATNGFTFIHGRIVRYLACYYNRIRLISHTLFSLFLTIKRMSLMVIVMTNFNLMAMANVSDPALTTTLHGRSFAGERTSQQQVTGKVVDPEGNPLQGVTVTVKGKAAAAKTDFDGAFSIAAQRGDVLELSFIGMKPQEVLVESNETLAITMEGDAVGIDEVVVIGYGVQKKVSITN